MLDDSVMQLDNSRRTDFVKGYSGLIETISIAAVSKLMFHCCLDAHSADSKCLLLMTSSFIYFYLSATCARCSLGYSNMQLQPIKMHKKAR